MKNYCPITTTTGGIGNRNAWGVDLNRNNTVGTLFDGYDGASTSCTSEVFTGPFEASEAEIKNEHWIGDTFTGIKFANNIHTHGGYFMWAPGAYIAAGSRRRCRRRTSASSGTSSTSSEHDPVAHPLVARHGDPAAAHGPDRRRAVLGGRQLGRRELLPARHHRLLVRGRRAADRASTRRRARSRSPTSASSRASPGRGRNGGQGACGCAHQPADRQRGPRLDDGVRRGQLRHDPGRARLPQGRHARRRRRSSTRPRRRGQAPINFRFNWVNEPSVIYYTTDGSTPTMVNCDTPTGSTRCLQQPGPAPSGRGAADHRASASTTSSGSPTDIKGNQSAVQTPAVPDRGRRRTAP